MKLLLTLTAALALITAPGVSRPAEACSCLPPDLPSAYSNDTDLLTISVVARYWGPIQTVYHARVLRSYKGCKATGKLIRLVTPTSSAACGVSLMLKRRYVVAGNALWPGVVTIHQCDFVKQWYMLTPAEHDFLDGRTICCQGACTCGDGSAPVACFADPCTVSSCPEGECKANYCGGCNAEYFTDAGHLVCNPCDSDADCAWDQHCGVEGVCRGGCSSDLDCDDDQWCRSTQSGGGECTPFAQQGESCGGFIAPWAAETCAPGLTCAPATPNVADLPGVCSAPCKGNGDCADGDYCANDGVCRSDGTCYAPADCSTPGNAWIHILCAGYSVCPFGECGWKCGLPLECKDVSGLDFGACKMLLGWGVVNGACKPVSGCDSLGYTFYGSQEECSKACNVPVPGSLHWYTTCGDPVCGVLPPGPGPKCTTETEGATCSTEGATCDPGTGCNVKLRCAASDPKINGCPISRADRKTDIRYATDADLARWKDELLSFPLATWRYKAQGEGAPIRLGFIIDDVEPSAAVDGPRDMVDLYGYLSMAVATLQVQEREIAALRAEVRDLRESPPQRPSLDLFALPGSLAHLLGAR